MIAITTMCLVGWGMIVIPVGWFVSMVAYCMYESVIGYVPSWEKFWRGVKEFTILILVLGSIVAWFITAVYLTHHCSP